MPLLVAGHVEEGLVEYFGYGAPTTGTAAIVTLTIGGTPTSGTFKLQVEGFWTAAITWSATNNTLRDNIDAALEALPSVGTGGVVTAVGTMTAGIGTMTVTFAATRVVQNFEVNYAALVGSGAVVSSLVSTPGVLPNPNGPSTGATYQDLTNGELYVNTGTNLVPVWEDQGP